MNKPDSADPDTNNVYDNGHQQAFIPYPPVGEKLEHVPIYVRPQLSFYIQRMGFLPNTLKLYLHTPWILEQVMELNNAVMRDERNMLDEHLKYKLSLLASRDNECPYCTAHNVMTLKQRWDHGDDDLKAILDLDQPADEREAVAMAFVHQASLDPAGVTDAMRANLAAKFSAQEVMEIVLIVGFWKMYNTMHLAMAAPIEEPAAEYRDWVTYGAY